MHWCTIITIVFVRQITCDDNGKWIEYGGESFPLKYLWPEQSVVTSADLDYYIEKLSLPLVYFNEAPNETAIGTALGAFYTKSLLKRTIKDYGRKLLKNQTKLLKRILEMCENLVSHYVYHNRPYGWDDMEYRVSQLFLSDDSQIYSIGDFNKHQLAPWILTSKNNVNEYLEEMDKATMPKETYCYLTDDNPGEKYYISMPMSDTCISRIPYNSEPIKAFQLRKCKPDPVCEKHIYKEYSIGYYLSHRLMNIYMRHSRGCYMRSKTEDRRMMDQICANMYREAVYLARRGYFARDVFLEHVALCGMLGYEEFHRRIWFRKVVSWINRHGCVVENRNFLINRSNFLKKVEGVRERQAYATYFCKELMSQCDEHPTALLMIVLGHAIRHAAAFMNDVEIS